MQADAGHIAYEGVVGLHVAESPEGVSAECGGIFTEVLFFDVVYFRQGGCGAERVLFVCVMTDGVLGACIVFVVCDNSRQWKEASAKGLSEDEDVRCKEVFGGEHPAGSAEAFDYLVEDQECSVFVAECLQLTPVLPAGDFRRGRYGFSDYRGDAAFALEDQFDLPETFGVDVAGILEVPWVSVVVREVDVAGAGNHGSEALGEVAFAAHGGSGKTRTVEGAPVRDGSEIAGNVLCQGQRHFDCLGAAGTEERTGQPAGRYAGEFFGEAYGGDVCVASWAECHPVVELFSYRGNYVGVVEACVVDAVSVHVDAGSALEVLNADALGFLEDVDDGGGQALMEKVFAVFFEPLAGLGGNVSLLVELSVGSCVYVALLGVVEVCFVLHLVFRFVVEFRKYVRRYLSPVCSFFTVPRGDLQANKFARDG